MIKNNKGFALTEVLIISTVVVGVLIFMYTQFKNINRSYQYSFRYDTVEGLYLTNNILQYISDNDYDNLVEKLEESEQKYLELEECDPEIFSTSTFCDMLFTKSKVDKVLFTKENLREFKSQMTDFDQDFQDYINQIQTSNNQTDYRIIVKYQNGTYASLRFNNENSYVKKGLITYLDAINNTGVGHSNEAETWMDLSGNDFNATLYNNPRWSSNSIIFDGATNYARIEDTASMSYENGVTIEARIKLVSAIGNDGYGNTEMFGNWEDGGLGLIYNSNTLKTKMHVNSAWNEYSYSNLINQNQYNTIIMSYDNQKVNWYINGQEASSVDVGIDAIIRLAQVPFAIGGNPAVSNETMDNYANVEVQNILIYNRAITQEEAQRNYQADIARY